MTCAPTVREETPLTVLVVEDDPELRRSIGLLLTSAGYEVRQAGSVREAIAAFRAAPPDLALLDHALGDGTAFDLLGAFGRLDPRVPVVVLTGSGSIELAVDAMKRGVRDFLVKPPKPAALLSALESALAARRRPEHGPGVLDPFVGPSAAIRALAGEASRVALSDSPVLIQGETGTGKTVLARWIHAHSRRAAGPFLDLNCAGFSREMLDSELFGHERGAFTGAVATKIGLLEAANGGTVFLDEIGDTDLQVQGKILKAIEERRFRRVGGLRDLTVDIRLVAATHRDLSERVAAQAFRPDLYFRISTLPLTVPPLRARREDLALLAERLLGLGGSGATLSPAGLAALAAHGWPGNIRELRNVLERAVLLRQGGPLGPEDLRLPAPRPANGDGAGAPLGSGDPVTLGALERSHILKVLAEEDWRVAEAAVRLGVPRSTLYQRLKEFGVQLPRSRRRV